MPPLITLLLAVAVIGMIHIAVKARMDANLAIKIRNTPNTDETRNDVAYAKMELEGSTARRWGLASIYAAIIALIWMITWVPDFVARYLNGAS